MSDEGILIESLRAYRTEGDITMIKNEMINPEKVMINKHKYAFEDAYRNCASCGVHAHVHHNAEVMCLALRIAVKKYMDTFPVVPDSQDCVNRVENKLMEEMVKVAKEQLDEIEGKVCTEIHRNPPESIDK